MLKSRKPSEDAVQPSNRTKLPLESGIRSMSGIKELLSMAESSRGHQFELEWTTGAAGQAFVLYVQWDSNADDPIWSLYEENDSASKKLWSQVFAAADVELFYDVLVMSCGAVTHSDNLFNILKSKAPPEKEEQVKSTTAEASNKKSQPEAQANPNTIATPATPPATNQPGGVVPGTAFPVPPYNMPPGMPGFPIAFPPGMPPGTGYMPPPIVPPPGWTFAPITPDNVGAMPTQLAPGHMAPVGRQAAEPLSSLPIDSALVNKRYAISLADLLSQAELINNTSLAAAVKIQTLVEEGKLPVERAGKILKEHHQKGAAIDSFIDSAVSTSAQETQPVQSTTQTSKAKPLSKDKVAALELLEKAGLLSKDDITTAKNVGRKHGGDMISILKSAQKLDDKTFEAALVCSTLLTEELMKLEQCVIALNYCSRSRVSFDEALAELNWPNPRKK